MLQMLKTEDSLADVEDTEKSSNDLLCVVCGDQATGRHYGTIACNGCKGFFRRTIRRAYKYTCRFNGNCNIDKHNRAVCRACRYMRCINAGMKVDAVQNERDVIGRRNRTPSSSLPSTSGTSTSINTSAGLATVKPTASKSLYRKQSTGNEGHFAVSSTTAPSWDTPRALLESLLISEKKIQSLRESVIKQTGAPKFLWTNDQSCQTSDAGRTATVGDIYLSIHSQLLLVIEWAKTLPPFAALSTEDQTALLKNYASQHIILGVSYRSKDNSDFLKLLNDSCIPRCRDKNDDAEYFENIYVRDCERIMDQLVAPMKFLKMDDVEFVALKACVLFNPVAKGLSSGSVMQVLATRRLIFGALEHYVSTKIPTDVNRIGDLTFFVLSPLQALANAVCEDVLVFKLSGVAHIDQLMEELILAETEEQKASNSANWRGLSVKNMYAEMLKVSNPNTPLTTNADSILQNQPTNTSSASSPRDILNAEFEVPSSYDDNSYSPTTTTLSSFIMDPFRSNPSSPTELQLTTVSSIESPTAYSTSWSVPSSHCTTYLDNDDYYAVSSMNL